jgi:tetratricopeptide (TPR) repeat protein
MLQRVGTEQYQLGNYAAAARSYEQAVREGGDAIVLNQRIGQSYSRLGRNSEAAEAYRRCIAACDAAIASGRGNRGRQESVKATAEQALKVLQGG